MSGAEAVSGTWDPGDGIRVPGVWTHTPPSDGGADMVHWTRTRLGRWCVNSSSQTGRQCLPLLLS